MERYLDPETVCEIVPGLTKTGLAQMRWRGDGPPYVKPTPKKVVYPETKLYAWLESRVQTSTREAVSA
jgi:hypothetical protein